MAFWTIKKCIDWCKTWCNRNARYFEWEYVWWRAHFAAAIKIYELFMNLLYKIARRRFHYLSEKGRFRNRTWWIKNDLEKWNTIVVPILLAKALSLVSWKLCASEWSNLFLYGIHVLQNQSEFILYILITFLMIFLFFNLFK